MGDDADFEVVDAPNGGPPEEVAGDAPVTSKKGKKKQQTVIGTGGVPLALLMKEVEKQHGAGVIVRATHFKALVLPRIQTTVFPFDLALGGGIARGRISLFAGGKGSGKSTVSLKTVARFHAMTAHLDPPPQAAWVDAEGVYDPDWALANGIDPARLVVVRPSYAEQAVDVFCACLSAKEIELLVLDSIAALVPMVEIEKSSANKQQGEQAQLVGKLVRRMVGAMNDWAQRDQPRTIILINQLRQKIGGWAPNGMVQEVEPGGMGQLFAASVTVRFKRIKYEYVDEKDRENGVGATAALNRFTVNNSKVSTPGQTGEFRLLLRDYAHLKRAECDDHKLVMNRAQSLAYVRVDGKEWVAGTPGDRIIHAEPTKQKMMDAWLRDKLLYARVQSDVIALAHKEGMHGASPDASEPQGDADERRDIGSEGEAGPVG